MPFVKLDCGILDSTLWMDRPAREAFVTALLMAEPYEITEPTPQLEIRSLDETGFVVPPGPYGFVRAAGVGILRRAGIDDMEEGLAALERLGSPEADSRTPDFDGRRMARVAGGFVILNYDTHRKRDYTAAVRQQRYRERHGERNAVTPSRHAVTGRHVTQAEAEAEAEVEETAAAVDGKATRRPRERKPSKPATEVIAEARQRYTPDQLAVIDAAVAGFATLRKNGKVAESVVVAEYHWWASFPPEQVVAGLQTYNQKRCALDGKGEKYARGIVRKTDPASAAESLGSGGDHRGSLDDPTVGLSYA